MKKLLLSLVLLAIMGLSNVFAQNYFKNESYDLNNNQVPTAWIFNNVLGNANISNGRLNAFIVDADGRLYRKGIIPAYVDSLNVEWDGNVSYALWGMYTGIVLRYNTNKFIALTHGYGDSWWGNKNCATLGFARDTDISVACMQGLDTVLLPMDTTLYHYTVSINKTCFKFKAKKISNGNLSFNVTDLFSQYDSISDFNLENISEIKFLAHCTTDNNVWLDNPKVTIYGGCYQTIYDTVHIAVTDTLIINAVLTGINPPSNINTLKVYPNPAKDHIYIFCGNYTSMNGYQIKIINTLSQSVFQTNITQQSYCIDLSTFNGTGTYFLQIYDNQSHLIDVKKIILQ